MLGCSDSIVIVILVWMYALSALGVENYPPINEQIEMFNVLLPSKAYPVIAPIFNTFYVNGIYIMFLFSFERCYTISVLPERRYLSLKRINKPAPNFQACHGRGEVNLLTRGGR